MVVNVDTGTMLPTRCGRNACTYCLQRNAYARSLAIALAAPERAILLTQVGDDHPQRRARLNRIRHELAREVGPFEWSWQTEPNPAGTGAHVHAWQHGSYVPQRLLSEVAARNGIGSFARVNRIRSVARASAYGLKGIGYGMKGTAADDAGAGYLVDNGGRLTHQSRGFFRAGAGQTVPVRVAERLARATGREAGTWVFMRRESVGATPGPA